MSIPKRDLLSDAIIRQSEPPDPPFRFCKVLSISAGVSAVIDYGGTQVTIVKASMYCSSFPAVNDWVCVGVNGSDRFILGKRLP